jgi:O-antigen ligase
VGSAASRWEILLLSLKVAARHPLLGIGMRNFEIVSIHGLVTHNAYTQVATEMGIPAMIVFIMFLVTPRKRLKEIEHETAGVKEQKWFYYLAVGLQASFVGFMVSIFFGAVAYQWYTYYLVGYAVCLRRVFESMKPETNPEIGQQDLARV